MDEKPHPLAHGIALLSVVGGLVYAVGYLVASMFHSKWGITDTQPIRAAYIHIGFLCLMPPVTPGVLVLFYLYAKGKLRPAAQLNAAVPATAAPCPSSTGNTACVPDAGKGAAYGWTLSGGTITAGQGTRCITYAANASGTVNITVNVTANGCSCQGTLSLIISPALDCTITAAAPILPNALEKMHPLGLTLLCILVFVFYWLALLAHPSTFADDSVKLGLVLLPAVTLGGLLTLPLIDWGLKKRNWEESKSIKDFKLILRCVFLAFAIWIGVRLFTHVDSSAVAMWRDHWYSLLFYLVVSILLIGLVGRNIHLWPSIPVKQKKPLIMANLVIALPLLYFAIMSFAYGVYPYVPSSRGGGGYVGAPKVQVVALDSSGAGLAGWEGTPLVQIMETDSTVFLAQWVADTTEWARPNQRPEILVVSKRNIALMPYVEPKAP